jgi:hypothetical protein
VDSIAVRDRLTHIRGVLSECAFILADPNFNRIDAEQRRDMAEMLRRQAIALHDIETKADFLQQQP